MPGTGPAPNPNRRRRNADVYADAQSTVKADSKMRGPALAGGPWSASTKIWYDTWRRSPQAAVFVATDWERLRMLAPLVEQYFNKPHHLTLGEIRLNEGLLGATHVDRLKARIKVEVEPAATEPAPTDDTSRRDRRLRLAG